MLAHLSNAGNPQDWPKIHQIQRCGGCGEWVYVLTHETTGKPAIIGAHTADGTLMVNLTRGTYWTVSRDEIACNTGWLRALHTHTQAQIDEWQGR